MVLCHGRFPIKKNKKNKTIKNAKADCKKTENKFLKKKENIYISNELMHIIETINMNKMSKLVGIII
jgi:hypothetical protein